MSNISHRTRIFDSSGKVVLAEWVSIQFREHDTCEIVGQTIGSIIEQVIPRPDSQSKSVVHNTKWRG